MKKNKLILLLFSIFIFFSSSSVYAETINTSFALDKSTSYYDTETNITGFGGHSLYYSLSQSVLGLTASLRAVIPTMKYTDLHTLDMYDISFTDIYSTSNTELSTNLDLTNTDGYNGSFSVLLGFSFGCSTNDYCSLDQSTQIDIGDNSYDTVPNLDFANYVVEHLELVYEDVNGRVRTTPLELVTPNTYWSVLYQSFDLMSSSGQFLNAVQFNASITDRTLFKFLGVRVNYDMSLIDWLSNSNARNTLQINFNNAITLNYADSDYGVQPPIPDFDTSMDDRNFFDGDINSVKQDNYLTILGNKIATNNVISDLFLLPVTLYQKYLNTINNTCSSFSLGNFLGTTITFPCINIQNYLGSSLYNTIDIIISGIFVLAIRKKFVDIFNNMTNLKDRGNEVE